MLEVGCGKTLKFVHVRDDALYLILGIVVLGDEFVEDVVEVSDLAKLKS